MAAATHPNLKQDLIASIVQRELEFQAKLLPTVTDFSQFAIPGVRSVSIPKLTSFTVNDRAFGASDTEQVLTDSVDQLLLDKNKIVSWIIDQKDQAQVTINAEAEYARRAASAHGRTIDTELVGVIEAAGRVDWGDGVATGDITRDFVLEMQEAAYDAEANLEDLVLVVSNDQHRALLQITEFTEQQVYGMSPTPIMSGQIGSLYGMPVIRRSGLGAQTYYMYERGGVGFAMQVGPQMDSEKDIQYGTQAMRYAMDALYGVKAMRLNEKGAGATESALIFKDRN